MEALVDRLSVNVIIIHCYCAREMQEIYKPVSVDTSAKIPSFFITFVRAHFYHMTKPMNSSETSLKRRDKYLCEVNYRNKLRCTALQHKAKPLHGTNTISDNAQKKLFNQ